MFILVKKIKYYLIILKKSFLILNYLDLLENGYEPIKIREFSNSTLTTPNIGVGGNGGGDSVTNGDARLKPDHEASFVLASISLFTLVSSSVFLVKKNRADRFGTFLYHPLIEASFGLA